MRRYACALSLRHFPSIFIASSLFPHAVWQPARHNSSKFCGRKPSGTKKSPDGSGSVVAAAAEPDDSVVAAASAAAMADAPKRRGGKIARKSRGAADEPKEPKALKKRRGAGVEDEDGIVAERASITKLFMVSDSVASIFCTLPQDQRSIDNYLKEVDQAVIPQRAAAEWGDCADTDNTGENNNNNNNNNSNNKKKTNKNNGMSHSNSVSSDSALATVCDAVARDNASAAKREIAKRVLSEERADYSLCIHVRDMEQLVPPLHIREGNNDASASAAVVGTTTTTTTTATATAVRKSTRRAAAAANGSSPVGAPPRRGRKSAAALSSAARISSMDRITALREWQVGALARARASQERHKVPDEYHAITRVRFHDPHKADLTVVQGCGGSKSVGDVLAAMNRNLRESQKGSGGSGGGGSESEGSDFGAGALDAALGGHSGAARAVAPAALSTPFSVRPLLSVVASCIPRREPALGARCGEETTFRPAAPTAAPRRTKPIIQQQQQQGQGQQGQGQAEEGMGERKVPPMPRYTTRVTVLVEHDELEPVDLLSMAERSTARKDRGDSDTMVARPPRRKDTHIYCLIADGGEF